MRTAFLKKLFQLAEDNPNVWLLTADVGYSVLEPFAKQFPERFLNVGVAEANMTGIAAGLAMSGKHVYTYSIANFPTLRCLEQIRNDICYHNLDVTIVAVGAGLSYGQLGYSHHGLEDISALRGMPNLTILSPADPGEVAALLPKRGPTYLRLGKAGEPDLHNYPVIPGKGVKIRHGSRATIFATGSILQRALEIPDVTVISMPTLVPIDVATILQARQSPHIITLEEHGVGGLASIIAEVLAIHGYSGNFTPIYVRKPPTPLCGTQDYLRDHYDLTVREIKKALNSASSAKTTHVAAITPNTPASLPQ